MTRRLTNRSPWDAVKAYHRMDGTGEVTVSGDPGSGPAGFRSIARGVLAPDPPRPRTSAVPSGDPDAGSRRAIVVLGDAATGPLLADMLVRAGAVDVVAGGDPREALARLESCATLVVDMEAVPEPWALARHARARDVAVGLVFVGSDVEAVEERALELGVAEVLDWDEVDGGALLRACRRAAWRARDRARLHRLARSDPATALASPLRLRDRLATALAAARRRGALCGCFHLLLGQDDRPAPAGDGLGGRLETLAALLAHRLRRADTVARLGPAEIGVLVEDLRRPEDAVTVARKLDAAAREAGFLPGFDLFGGVTLGPGTGDGVEPMLAAALDAAGRARRERRAFAFADPGFDARARALLEAAAALDEDLAADRLAPVLHPRIALHPGPAGYEIGFAWAHGGCGRLEGEALADLAACVGLADRLAERLLEATLRMGVTWREAGLGDFHLAVPLPTRRALAHLDLAERMATLLDRHRPPPGCVELELGEAHLLQALETPSLLRDLAALPVRLAVRGFGRGPTSLRLLWELPLDTVRIAAGTFTPPPGRNEPPVFELVRLAKAAGRRVVVEVDGMDRLPALRRLGCDAVQWVRGRPALTEDEARRRLLRERGARTAAPAENPGSTHDPSPDTRAEPEGDGLRKS